MANGDITLIIHGWSDCSKSFQDLKDFLVAQGVGTTKTIFYADYESREDNITFNDVVDGLHQELIKQGIIDRDGKKLKNINVIVHSTGGLVIRHWLWRYYFQFGCVSSDCPVRRIVMLAPANFGSPLAHRGKSLLGAFVKGRWKVGDLLEVGRQLLNGLELASPYQWALAHRDLLAPEPWYHPNAIQLTILVGIQDYEGLRGLVNAPGTDGTVTIAGTPLNTVKFLLDFSKKSQGKKTFEWMEIRDHCRFAFGVLPGLNHGSIVQAIPTARNGKILREVLLQALTTGARQGFEDDFEALIDHLKAVTAETYAATRKPKYQQFIIRAVDDHDAPVRDYTLAFSVCEKQSGKPLAGPLELFSAEVHKMMVDGIHTHSEDSSYRRLHVNVDAVQEQLKKAEDAAGKPVMLCLNMFIPAVDRGIYYDNDNLRQIVLFDPTAPKGDYPSFLYPNTTTLLEMKVSRDTSYVTVSTEPRAH